MRIGFFTDTYFPRVDGVVFSIEIFRRELEALGHEVYIFAPRPSLRYRSKNDHIIYFSGIKNKEMDYVTKFPWTPQAYRKASKLNLDIIHTHTPFELGIFGIAVALKENIPLVTTYHTDILEYVKHYPKMFPGGMILAQILPFILGQPELFKDSIRAMKPERNVEAWSQKVVGRFIPLINNLCDLVIAPSDKVKVHLSSTKTTAPIKVLPTGVDKVTTSADQIALIYKRFGLARDEKIILYVGRLSAEKNLQTLISAFAEIASVATDTKLLIIGDGPYRKELEKLAKPLADKGRVIFTGYIRDREVIGAAYEASRVFAFPSQTDTQGLVIHEAAAAGLPTVMIDRGITDVVVNNKSGLYAKNTPPDFAAKLLRILQDDNLYHKLSKNSIKMAAQVSARQQTLKLEVFYQDLLKQHQLKSKTSGRG